MTAAGWYPDPQSPERARWWDGERWTQEVREKPTAPVSAPSAPSMPPAPSASSSVSSQFLGEREPSRPFSGEGGYQGYTSWDKERAVQTAGTAGGYSQREMQGGDEWQPFSPSGGIHLDMGAKGSDGTQKGAPASKARFSLPSFALPSLRVSQGFIVGVIAILLLVVGAVYFSGRQADPGAQEAAQAYLQGALSGDVPALLASRCAGDQGQYLVYDSAVDPLGLNQDIVLAKAASVSATTYEVLQEGGAADVTVTAGESSRVLHLVMEGESWKVCSQ